MRGIGCQDNTAFKKGASATFWQTRTCHLQSEKAISGPGGVGGGSGATSGSGSKRGMGENT